MSTQTITRYFAFTLATFTITAIIIMIVELMRGVGTPMYFLGIALCLGYLFIAYRLAHQRDWAMAFYTVFCFAGIQGRNIVGWLCLAHAIAATIVLLLRGRELKPGL